MKWTLTWMNRFMLLFIMLCVNLVSKCKEILYFSLDSISKYYESLIWILSESAESEKNELYILRFILYCSISLLFALLLEISSRVWLKFLIKFILLCYILYERKERAWLYNNHHLSFLYNLKKMIKKSPEIFSSMPYFLKSFLHFCISL